MGRAERITAAVRRHDEKLFCRMNMEGKLCIFREGTRMETYLVDEHIIHFARPAPHYVFAITHNWKPNGESVEWGIEPIMNKVRSCDLWTRDLVSDIEKNEERIEKLNARDLSNKTEDFVRDWHSKAKSAFNDVNTANMSKENKRIKKGSKWEF